MSKKALDLTEKQKQRQSIKKQIDEYLAQGGHIDKLPCYYDQLDVKNKLIDYDDAFFSIGSMH